MKKSVKKFSWLLSILLLTVSTGAYGKNLADLPEKVLLTGVGDKVLLKDFTQIRPLLVVVGSHDTIPLIELLPFKWHDRGWKLAPKQFLGVAAVSKAPWLVKTLFIRGTLTQAKGERDKRAAKIIPGLEWSTIVVDLEGEMATALGVDKQGKRGYAAFVIEPSGTVLPLIKSQLDEGDDEVENLDKAAQKILDIGEGYFGVK
jgi:hypothetical protein